MKDSDVEGLVSLLVSLRGPDASAPDSAPGSVLGGERWGLLL